MLPLSRDDSGEFAGIWTLTLDQGKPVVVLDAELIRDLDDTLAMVPPDARGVVLRSASEKVFVAGADLKSIMAMDDDSLHRYLQFGSRVFGRLSQLPCPTVAAINGAALGGGLELAMHCDGLVACPGAKPYPVGLPEAGLSICPGWGGTCLLPARMKDKKHAITQTALGKPMLYDEAKSQGLFDDTAADAAGLLNCAKRWLVARGKKATHRDGAPDRWVGRMEHAADTLTALDAVRAALPDTGPSRAVCEAIDIGLARGWKAALEIEQRHLVRLRNEPAGREAINAFFEKSKR